MSANDLSDAAQGNGDLEVDSRVRVSPDGQTLDLRGEAYLKYEAPGGIDLDPAQMNMQVKDAGSGFEFNIDSAMLNRLQNAPGLTPVIIDIHPMTTPLSMFLGLKPDAPV